MLKKNIPSINILFFLFCFVVGCNYKNAKHFSPTGSALGEIIPSLPDLEGQFGVTYTYTQNTCDNQTGEFNTTAAVRISQSNTDWIDVLFPDASDAISGPYDEETGNFMGETDRKPIGQGYTAQEMWNMDFYPRMSNDDIIAFGGISRVDVYNPDDSFNCRIDYNIYGEKTSSELPPAFYALTVEKEGDGSVSSSPAGIDCGEDCSEEYEEGTEIILTASAEVGWVFDGWSSDVPDTCSDESENCAIVMDGAKTVVATFVEIPKFSLNVEVEGGGSVTSEPEGIGCGEDCSEEYIEGTEVTLMPVPDEGYTFDGWSGDVPDECKEENGDCKLKMDNNRTVKAVFKKEQTKKFIFGKLRVCVEHGTKSSRIYWLWEFTGELGLNAKTVMKVKEPNGDVKEISVTPKASDQSILAALTIAFFGDYDWEVTKVKNNDTGDELEFEGDTSGVVKVDSKEQNAGQCKQ